MRQTGGRSLSLPHTDRPLRVSEGGKRGKVIELSGKTRIAPTDCTSVPRGIAITEKDVVGCLCGSDWVPSYLREVAPQPRRRGAADTSTPRPRQYGPEVQHALFLVWHAANRICAKRLIPFLPIFIEALERHEHLQISEECRRQLLSMSAATADRLLASQRKLG
jgi:hypothetical protein